MPSRPAVAMLLAALGALTPALPARADDASAVPLGPPPAPAAMPAAYLGYLGGNGLGELGAEAGMRVAPHVALGLQAGRLASAAGSGFGLAPLLRVSLWPHGGPYVALGASWFSVATDATTRASGTAVLGGVGFEWRPAPQFGLLAGAGVAWVPSTSIDRAGAISAGAGGVKPNFELGLRWYAF